jgi:hypothetical protein
MSLPSSETQIRESIAGNASLKGSKATTARFAPAVRRAGLGFLDFEVESAWSENWLRPVELLLVSRELEPPAQTPGWDSLGGVQSRSHVNTISLLLIAPPLMSSTGKR